MSKPKAAAKASPAPAAPQRRGPAKTLPWDSVLGRWAAGQDTATIATAEKIGRGAVTRIVCLSRKRGDERAKRRKAPAGQPGTGSMIGTEWVPYWADPRQLPLPLSEPGNAGAALVP